MFSRFTHPRAVTELFSEVIDIGVDTLSEMMVDIDVEMLSDAILNVGVDMLSDDVEIIVMDTPAPITLALVPCTVAVITPLEFTLSSP